jgi:transposase
MYVGKGNGFLPEISLRQLKNRYKQEQSNKARFRLRCAYLRKMGESIPAIASVTGIRESTISDILRRFEAKGLQAAHAVKQSGQPKRINRRKLLNLKIAIINPPLAQDYPFAIWTTALTEYYIKERLGACIGKRHLVRILKKLGFRLAETKTEHVEANSILQKKYAKSAPRRLKKLFNSDRRSPHWVKN